MLMHNMLNDIFDKFLSSHFHSFIITVISQSKVHELSTSITVYILYYYIYIIFLYIKSYVYIKLIYRNIFLLFHIIYIILHNSAFASIWQSPKAPMSGVPILGCKKNQKIIYINLCIL